MRFRFPVLAATMMMVAGCGLSGAPEKADSATVNVWLMRGSVTKEFTRDLIREFENKNPGSKVELTIHDWDKASKEVPKALQSEDAPDVIEVGTTQVPQYVSTHLVKDLTLKAFNPKDPDGSAWVPALAESGRVDGSQYGIPFYAANRVVVYRKDMFEQMGIDEPPKTREEWLRDTKTLDASKGQQGIYLPGKYWYVLAGFLWDEGGDIANEKSGVQTGTLDTPASLRAMDFYKKLQALGDGPKDGDEASPVDQIQAFAKGKIAQIVALPGAAQGAVEANSGLRDKIGFFPVPGKTEDKPGAVFTGGSELIIPEKAADQDKGYEFIEALTSRHWQRRLAKTMNYVPNRNSLIKDVADDPGSIAMAKGARNGRTVPSSPYWGAVEADNPLKEFQQEVLTGADPKKAATKASKKLTKLLRDGTVGAPVP